MNPIASTLSDEKVPPEDVSSRGSPLPYASTAPGNRPAVESLVWGLLLFIPFVAGVVAIRRGRRGLRVAKDLGGAGGAKARAGIALGVVNLALSTFVAAAAVPAVMYRQREARRVMCMSQVRQLATAAQMYANANAGAVPPDLDALASTMGPAFVPTVCSCPEAAHNGTPAGTTLRSGAACSYVYVPPSPGVNTMSQVPNPATTVMAFEPLANHGGRGFNVAYWDGHSEWQEGPGAAGLAAQLTAQAAANAAARQVGAPAPATAPTNAPTAPE